MHDDLLDFSITLTKLLGDPLVSISLIEYNVNTKSYTVVVNGCTGIGVEINSTFHIALLNGISYVIDLPTTVPTIPEEVIAEAKSTYGDRWNKDTIVLYSPSTGELSVKVLPKLFSDYNKGIRTMKLKAITSNSDLLVVNLDSIME